jgi:signal transduction histidine kinase
MNIRKSLALTILTPLLFSSLVAGVLSVAALNAESRFAQQQKLRQSIASCNTFMSEMLQGGTTLAISMQGEVTAIKANAEEYNTQFARAEHALDSIETINPSLKPRVSELRSEMQTLEMLAKKTFVMTEAKNHRRVGREARTSAGFEALDQAKRVQRLSEELQSTLTAEYRSNIFDNAVPVRLLTGFAIVSAAIAGVITIFAGIFVGRNIVNRLNVLHNNANALSKRQQLSKPLQGEDEIAEADRAFRRMAEELTLRLKRERAIIDNSLDVICSFDENKKFKTVSPSSVKLWSKDADQLIKQGIDSVFAGRALSILNDKFSEAKVKNGDVIFSLTSLIEEREEATILCSIKWVEKESSFYCVFHDDTENERRRQLIRENEARIRILLESIPVAVLVLDSKGQIELSNRTFDALLLERSYAERRCVKTLVGMNFLDFIGDKSTTSNIEEFFHLAVGKSLECNLYCGEKLRRAQISVEPFEWAQKPAWLAVIVDIDERHQIEASRQRLIATVAHDVRTPLTSVQCSTMLLLRRRAAELDQINLARMQLVENEAIKLVELFDGLLTTQRYGARELSPESFCKSQLDSLVEDVVDVLSEELIRKGVTIDYTAPSDAVTIDSQRFSECIAKLCRLLLKYSNSGDEHRLVVALSKKDTVSRVANVIVSVSLSSHLQEVFAESSKFSLEVSVVQALAQSMGGSLHFMPDSLEMSVPAFIEPEVSSG